MSALRRRHFSGRWHDVIIDWEPEWANKLVGREDVQDARSTSSKFFLVFEHPLTYTGLGFFNLLAHTTADDQTAKVCASIEKAAICKRGRRYLHWFRGWHLPSFELFTEVRDKQPAASQYRYRVQLDSSSKSELIGGVFLAGIGNQEKKGTMTIKRTASGG